MIVPFLLIALQQPVTPGGGPSFIQQAIGQPTGRNGYEEYVAAAEIAESPAYQTYETYDASKDVANRATQLEAWHEQVRRFTPIADLVVQGNGKPVYDPKPRLNSRSSIELAGFPGVADYLARKAYVDLSNGDPQNAERALEVGLQFVYNLDNGTSASGTAAAVSAERMFRAIKADLPKLGVRELDRLADAVTQILGQAPSPINNLQAIRRADIAFAERALRDPRSEGPVGARLANLSPTQRERTLRQFLADEDSFLQSVIGAASLPESKWDNVQFEEADPIASELARSSVAGNGEVLANAAKLRTRLRIVRLLSRVYRYKWQYDQLPSSLAKAAKPAETLDPLTGNQFVYAAREESIEVSSESLPLIGPGH